MKKIVYLAPLALLGVGAKVSANQVPTHISNALRIYEQENQPVGQNENEQGTHQAKPSLPNGQNQPVGKGREATHISRLDSGLIDGNSLVGNEQASQVMKISRTAIPTKQGLSESKDSVAGQYVQVQQNRVAQFNNGSKIYGLNNSNQLSKNNGDGYVITNAGTFNGRPVDIGVTINNVQNNRGSYTTKWSNGDKADTIGSVDNQFDYQNGVTLNSNAVQPTVSNQTRNRIENQQVDVPIDGIWIVADYWETTPTPEEQSSSTIGGDEYSTGTTIYDPKLIGEIMHQTNCDYKTALSKLGIDLDTMTKAHANINVPTLTNSGYTYKSGSYVDMYHYGDVSEGTLNGGEATHNREITYHVAFDSNSDIPKIVKSQINGKSVINSDLLRWPGGKSNDKNDEYYNDPLAMPGYADGSLAGTNSIGVDDYTLIQADSKFNAYRGIMGAYRFEGEWSPDGKGVWRDGEITSDPKNFNKLQYYPSNTNTDHANKYPNSDTGLYYVNGYEMTDDQLTYLSQYMVSDGQGYKTTITKPVSVTDQLQLDQVKDGNLNYDYTVGLYDHNTGDLITSLKPEYKNGVKVGKTATNQDTAMNDAVKAKIQAINANQANSAYTGTAANDDITFNKNTVHVNYVDEHGQRINVPGYDIDVDNLTSGNYQVPQNYTLVNPNGFKVTKNTHEVNGVTVTDSYNFIDQGNNKVTDNGRTLSVVLTHGTKNVDLIHSNLSNDATNNVFVINNGAKRQINSQSRHFGASGVLDLVTNKVTKQGDWVLLDKSNFDQVTINNNLIGYGNTIHNNLTFLAL